MELPDKLISQITKVRTESILELTKTIQDKINLIPKVYFDSNVAVNKEIFESINKQFKQASKVIESISSNNFLEIAKAQTAIINSIKLVPPSFPTTSGFEYPPTERENISEVNELKRQIADRDREIALLKSTVPSPDKFGIKALKTGNFKYENKILKISADSNAGKFLKYSLEDSDNFVPDTYCFNEFNCSSSKEITYITRDLNSKYLYKDGLRAKYQRCRDAKGYILIGIFEI